MTHSSIVFSRVLLAETNSFFFLAGGCKNYIEFDMYSSLLFKSYVMWVEYCASNAMFQMQWLEGRSEQRNSFLFEDFSSYLIHIKMNTT